jgi:Spy/CpxP family protein refolding chaperone
MPPPPPPDPLADVMFPPDLILNHARQLQLTDDQKAFIRGELQKTMTTFNELQWKLQDEMEALHDTLKANAVDEQQALAQLNKVLDIEREIKRLHIGMGVRIKNHLTPEQQERIEKIRMQGVRVMPPPPEQAQPNGPAPFRTVPD